MRHLTLLPAYVGFMLVSLNLSGADPSDAIFLATAATLLLLQPLTYGFPSVSTLGKMGVAAFLLCYIVSCLSGYRATFVLYMLSNLAMAVSAGYFVGRDPRFRIGAALFFGFVALNVAAVALWAVGIWPESIFFELFRDGRYMGAMGDPNFTGLMSAFTLYYLLDRVLRSKPSRAVMALNIVSIALTLMMLLFSQSRSAWAAAGGGLVMYLVASRQLFTFRTMTALFGLVMVVMVLTTTSIGGLSDDVGSVSDRISTIFVQNDAAEQERFKFVYTRTSLEVGRDHPLGVGPGMTFTYTGLVNIDGGAIGAHNAYVEILTENGWLAMLTFVALLTVAWLRLFRLATVDAFLNDVSCRTILAGLTATALFGIGHDLIGWRIGWVFPILAVLTAYHVDFAKLQLFWDADLRKSQ